MDKPKLTIEQLKNYLGTGLKCKPECWNHEIVLTGFKEYKGALILVFDNSVSRFPRDSNLKFYRLSDLDKHIPELGLVPLDWFEHTSSIDFLADNPWVKQMFNEGINPEPDFIPWGVYKQLFQWHFWPFGDEYFDQGLIIDKLIK